MTHPLKLLQIGKHFPPDNGGIETVTANLSHALLPESIVADVLCLAYPGLAYESQELPFRVIRAAPDLQVGNKILSTDYVRRLRRLESLYDVGLLHLPHPLGAAAALAFWHKPLLLLWHADIPQPILRRLLHPLDRLTLRRADAVILPTPVHGESSHLSRWIMPKSRVALFPFSKQGLSAPTPDTQPMQQVARFTNGRRVVLAVGRLVSYKGFDVLIRAAAKLPSDVAVVIVGSGGLQAELAAMIRSGGVSSSVLLAGPLSEGDLSACYEAAAIVCMPSVTAAEMYGMVQVEAMARGKPVVSTAIPRSGVSWVNRHDVSGLVVPAGDADALAGALTRLLGDPDLHARLSNGAARVFREHHDYSRSGRRYGDIIREFATPK